MASALNKFQNLILTLFISARYNIFFIFHGSILILAKVNMLLCLRSHIAHSPLCTSTSILKTKVDSYMPCEAMAHSPKYINPLTSSTTVLPSCSNFKVLLTLIFLVLISKTNMLGEILKLIGCIISEKHCGDISWVSCCKDPSQLQVDFGVSPFWYNTNSSLSLIDNSEYSHLVHSRVEKATGL